MALNIFELISAKRENYLKTNRFEISITVPWNISLTTPGSYLCTGASLNFFQILNNKQFYNNKYYNTAYGRDYDPITLTFDVDTSASSLKFFKKWFEGISPKDGIVNYPNEYKGTISISGLTSGVFSKTAFTCQLNGAFPINFTAIEYDQNSADSIASYSVTFDYESIKLDDGSYFI